MSKHERSNSQENVLKHPSTKRAKEIDQNAPMDQIDELLENQSTNHQTKNVLHWFRSKDIRMEDNRGLAAASKKAKDAKTHLITMYLYSPEDLEWHGTSPARSDFILESLRLLQKQLQDMNIPLAFVTAEHRSEKTDKVLDFIKKHDITHVHGNLEYEIDELRRDINILKKAENEKDLSLELFHDQTIVTPGELLTGGGGPHKVFTPYHGAWLEHVGKHTELLEPAPSPSANDKSATKDLKELFDTKVPSLPKDKGFPDNQTRDRIRKLWPPGHKAGMDRLDHFLKEKVKKYAKTRSNPAADSSSRLSPYFASNVIGIRETLNRAYKANGNKNFTESGDPGIAAWVREIVFREFYRHTLTFIPHNSLNLPQNLKFDNVKWEDDEEGWYKWCEGKTGMPFVDAGMRQLNHEAYLHNRLRMNVASYLRTNLLLDYRRGERYFTEHLVDWDLANNHAGWEPSYTVFNPISQAERNDPDGDYIRRWVPELKDVQGKAIFMPYERLSKEEFNKLGYPKPHVDFNETKTRAIERYKQDLADADP